MADLAKLVARLELQSAQFQKELERTNQQITRFARGSQSNFNKVERAAKALGSAFKLAFAGLSVAGIAAFVNKTAEFGDQLNKASIKAGVSAEAISQLAYAAKQSGVELGSLSTALQRMQKTISEAGSGMKAQQRVLDALGVSVKELRRLAPDKQFELLADRISKLKDPSDRTRAAVELFGRAGADLLPMFEQGSEGIRKLREEAVKVGQSFSKEQLDKLTAAKDAVDSLGSAFSSLATVLVAKVAPAFTRFFRDMAGLTPEAEKIEMQIRNLRSQLASGSFTEQERLRRQEEITRLEVALAYQRAQARRAEGRFPRGSTVRVTEVTPPGFQPEEQETRRGRRVRAPRLREGGPLITVQPEDLENRRFDQFEDALDSLDEHLRKTAGVGEKTFDSISVYADQAARNMQDAFADFLFDPFEKGVKGMLKSFVDILRRMVAEAAAARVFEALFGKPGQGSGPLSGLLGGIFGGSVPSVGGSGIVQGEWDWFDKLIRPRRGGLFGVLGGLFGGFRADGGPVARGKAYVVGERGPELFMPQQSGMIAAGAGGPSIVINNNIDARGATTDLVRALPDILKRNSEETEARIVQRLRRRTYDL